jgi:hypothetical protein
LNYKTRNMKPENPNAFPLEETDTAGYHYQTHYGMTLRDYFAAKSINVTASKTIGIEEAAKMAYTIADAMLKARG